MEKFQMKKMAVAITLSLGALTGTQSFAQTQAQNLSQGQTRDFAEAKFQLQNGKRVAEIGVANEEMRPLKGFATSLPFVEVLKQITPNGWVVKKNDNADNRIHIQQNVSWGGGQTWINTLHSVLSQTNATAVVDWNNKEIILLPQQELRKVIQVTEVKEVKQTTSVAPIQERVSVFEMDSGRSQVTTVSTETVVKGSANYNGEVSGSGVVTTPAHHNWTLTAGKSLKENVLEWGVKAGYKVEWLADDYNIETNRVLQGAFDGEDGPIKQISNDYGPNSRLQKPLAFILYQNGYLVVEEMKFEQQGFPQFSN